MAASISLATYYHRGIHLLQILLKALELAFNNLSGIKKADGFEGAVIDSTKNLVQRNVTSLLELSVMFHNKGLKTIIVAQVVYNSFSKLGGYQPL